MEQGQLKLKQAPFDLKMKEHDIKGKEIGIEAQKLKIDQQKLGNQGKELDMVASLMMPERQMGAPTGPTKPQGE